MPPLACFTRHSLVAVFEDKISPSIFEIHAATIQNCHLAPALASTKLDISAARQIVWKFLDNSKSTNQSTG